MHNRRASGSGLRWIACTNNWTVAALANPISTIHDARAMRGPHSDV